MKKETNKKTHFHPFLFNLDLYIRNGCKNESTEIFHLESSNLRKLNLSTAYPKRRCMYDNHDR